MLKLNNLVKYFSKGTSAQVQALDHVSIEVGSNEFVILMGANGSGKSTLLNVIAGNLFPDSGLINLDGNDVTSMPVYKRSKWISRVFQDPLAGTAGELTVLENFRLAALRTRSKNLNIGLNTMFRNKTAEQVSKLGLGLETKLDTPIAALSGGQRQAITLLMSVMDDTKLLLLDEPASALDPKTAQLVMKLASDIIKEFQISAILVTHNYHDAFMYGDRIIQLGEGRVVRDVKKDIMPELTAEDIFKWF